MKKRRCVNCKKYFPASEGMILPVGFIHDDQCAIEYSKRLRVKREKTEHSQAKKRLKDNDKSFQLKKTQQLFNRYIRLRDRADPCISCSRFHHGQYHAGHFLSVGASPELRFDERNCHKQCSACNNYLSGNIINYRINLINKIGNESIQYLEGSHEPKRYTIKDLKEIQDTYKAKLKELESKNV